MFTTTDSAGTFQMFSLLTTAVNVVVNGTIITTTATNINLFGTGTKDLNISCSQIILQKVKMSQSVYLNYIAGSVSQAIIKNCYFYLGIDNDTNQYTSGIRTLTSSTTAESRMSNINIEGTFTARVYGTAVLVAIQLHNLIYDGIYQTFSYVDTVENMSFGTWLQ